MAYKKCIVAVLSGTALLLATGCDQYVEKAKYDALNKELADTKAELVKTQAKLDEKPKHNYSLFNSGVRTFRVDSLTGESCIELTTAADWKQRETKANSCGCADAMQQWMDASADASESRVKIWEKLADKACGRTPERK